MATQTIGTGGDQPDWATWEATLGSLAANETGAQLNEELPLSAKLTVGGITLNGFTLTLTANAGDSFVDLMDPDTDPLFYDATKGAAVNSNPAGDLMWQIDVPCTISRLQFKHASNYNVGSMVIANGAGMVLEQFILQTTGAAAGNGAIHTGGHSGAGEIRLGLVVNSGNGNAMLSGGGDINWSNVGFINLAGGASRTGPRRNYGTPIFKNCYSVGYGTDYSGTVSASSSNNATDAGSFGGTNWGGSGQTSVVAATEFTSATTDFRLKAGGTKLQGTGTATGTPTTDIFGRAWGTRDIGPIAFAAAGGGGIPIAAIRHFMANR